MKFQPYYGYSNQEVISMVRARQLVRTFFFFLNFVHLRHVSRLNRKFSIQLPCPEVCPSAVYSLMVECWHEQAVRRPSFPEIGHRLKIWYQAQKRSNEREFTN